jgi:hypothetical protein
MQETLVYPAVGKCIYCLGLQALQTEHIVPYSLGGSMLLPKASCGDCGKVTSAFEGRVAGGMFKAFRAKINAPTRSKVGHPTEFPTTFFDLTTVSTQRKLLSIGEIPGFLQVMYIDHEAGLVSKKPTSPIVHVEFGWVSNSAVSDSKDRDFQKSVHCDLNIEAFVRMLAKIGHAYVWAELGGEGWEPLLVPLIISAKGKWENFIGKSPVSIPPAMLAIRILHRDNDSLITVLMTHPFLAQSGPVYEVVVGQIRNRDLVEGAAL